VLLSYCLSSLSLSAGVLLSYCLSSPVQPSLPAEDNGSTGNSGLEEHDGIHMAVAYEVLVLLD